MVLVQMATMVAGASAAPASPWWGKVLMGLLLIAIGVGLNWAIRADKISFGEIFQDYAMYLTMMVMVVGVCVMLWGLGVDFG
jgi:hypothetical protein